MTGKWYQRFVPTREQILNNRSIKIFGHYLQDQNLWHLNRYSVSTAISIGFFVMFLPFPGHTIVVTLLAIILRANLLITIAAVWANNPFTMIPMYYFAYRTGAYILNTPIHHFHVEHSWHWLTSEFMHVVKPLLFGGALCGFICALIGNMAIRLWWRFTVSLAYRKRQKQRVNSQFKKLTRQS